MKLAVLVNDVKTETPRYTTTALLRAARERGHDAFVLGTSDFVHDRDRLEAWAHEAPDGDESADVFVARMQADVNVRRIPLDDIDVLLLRNNPFDDLGERAWAAQVGLLFGEEAQRRGTIVLNDPAGLARALSKLYLERFPAHLRPASLITRHMDDVRAFAREHGTIVVKPLVGSGGRGVFVLHEGDDDNANQIFEAVGTFGYVLAQEYLPNAREGDVRLVLLDGRPMIADGKIAAYRRIGANGDLRNNVKAGATAEAIEIDDVLLEIADAVRPQLVADGMWLVGLDIVGDKVMEVNVWSTGGLVAPSMFHAIDFAAIAIEDLERKVESKNARIAR